MYGFFTGLCEYGAKYMVYKEKSLTIIFIKLLCPQDFFTWLDVGEGKDLDLAHYPRANLESHLVTYLNEKERYAYAVKVRPDGKLAYCATDKLVTTEVRASASSLCSVSLVDKNCVSCLGPVFERMVDSKGRKWYEKGRMMMKHALAAGRVAEDQKGFNMDLRHVDRQGHLYRPQDPRCLPPLELPRRRMCHCCRFAFLHSQAGLWQWSTWTEKCRHLSRGINCLRTQY